MTNPSVVRFAESAQKLYEENRAVVFLCGPALSLADSCPAAMLRGRLSAALSEIGFEVVLGEDDGLEDVRLSVSGGYAHDNELEFIRKECCAIVIVAGSVGSFCELGLFVHWIANSRDRMCDLILLADKAYQSDKSYFNEGPARAAEDFGKAMYVDFSSADIEPVLKRLKGRRSTHFLDGRGRPAKVSK